MVGIKKARATRITQGDVFRDVECIEYVVEKKGVLEVSKIAFPLVVVLSQDCDLEQDARIRGSEAENMDKLLFSALVAPIYNAEHVFTGSHLSDLGLKMSEINARRTPGEFLKKNERPRYHYIDFPSTVPLVPGIVDFKHFFSVNIEYLKKCKPKKFVCQLSELYREDLSQRFAAYLARIGLPEETHEPKPQPAVTAKPVV